MLVICEDCAKKYNVDENKIKGERARFSCYECGHIIVVIKPKKPVPSFDKPEASDESEMSEIHGMSDEEAMAFIANLDAPESTPASDITPAAEKKSGNGIGPFLLIALLLVCGIAAYIFLL